MYISRIKLFNWKNFHDCEVVLSERCFIVGANATGKSNFLDVIRFMRDIVKQGGGLQAAVALRGGLKRYVVSQPDKNRSLYRCGHLRKWAKQSEMAIFVRTVEQGRRYTKAIPFSEP